jgi:hypothetical protein
MKPPHREEHGAEVAQSEAYRRIHHLARSVDRHLSDNRLGVPMSDDGDHDGVSLVREVTAADRTAASRASAVDLLDSPPSRQVATVPYEEHGPERQQAIMLPLSTPTVESSGVVSTLHTETSPELKVNRGELNSSVVAGGREGRKLGLGHPDGKTPKPDDARGVSDGHRLGSTWRPPQPQLQQPERTRPADNNPQHPSPLISPPPGAATPIGTDFDHSLKSVTQSIMARQRMARALQDGLENGREGAMEHAHRGYHRPRTAAQTRRPRLGRAPCESSSEGEALPLRHRSAQMLAHLLRVKPFEALLNRYSILPSEIESSDKWSEFVRGFLRNFAQHFSEKVKIELRNSLESMPTSTFAETHKQNTCIEGLDHLADLASVFRKCDVDNNYGELSQAEFEMARTMIFTKNTAQKAGRWAPFEHYTHAKLTFDVFYFGVQWEPLVPIHQHILDLGYTKYFDVPEFKFDELQKQTEKEKEEHMIMLQEKSGPQAASSAETSDSGVVETQPEPTQSVEVTDDTAAGNEALAAALKEIRELGHKMEVQRGLAEEHQRDLENLQVRELQSLVETVTVDGVKKRLLFLSQSQATEFDFTDMHKTLLCLGIDPPPKLVINLCPALMKGKSAGDQIPTGVDSESTVLTHHTHCEVSTEAYITVDQRLTSFLKECIFEVACRQRAIVIVHSDSCQISVSFSAMCEMYAKGHGGKLPFTVLFISGAHALRHAAIMDGSTSNKICHQSDRWKDYLKRSGVSEDAQQESEHEASQDEQEDCLHGASDYVITEGDCEEFENSLIQALTNTIPAIGVAVQNTHITALTDFTARGMPLLLLDSRPYPRQLDKGRGTYGKTLNDAEQDLLELESQLIAAGTVNRYNACTLAHLHFVLTRMSNNDDEEEDDDDDNDDKNKYVDTRVQKPIYELLEEDDKNRQRELQNRKLDCDDIDDRGDNRDENVTAVLKMYCRMAALRGRVLLEWHCRKLLEACTELEDKVKKQELEHTVKKEETEAEGFNRLDKWLEEVATWEHNFKNTPLTNVAHTLLSKHADGIIMHKAGEPMLVRVKGVKDGHNYAYVPRVNRDQGATPTEISSALSDTVKEIWRDVKDQGEGVFKGDKLDGTMVTQFLPMKEMLSSDMVYSANLNNMQQLKRIVNQIAKIDRLPAQNTLAALRTLRQVWDCVDIFSHHATRYKYVTKSSYAVLLLLGWCIVALTVSSMNLQLDDSTSGYLPRTDVQHYVLFLSLAASLVAGMTTYLSPSKRWLQMRGAALLLESEVWKFRTRCGQYALPASTEPTDEPPEVMLLQVLELTKKFAGKSVGIGDTSIYSQFELFGKPGTLERRATSGQLKIYKHGQYKGACNKGTWASANPPSPGIAKGNMQAVDDKWQQRSVDDHHSPCSPDRYLSLRVEPMTRFYQRRLPKYYKYHSACEMILLTGTLAGTLMAFLNLAQWVSLLNAFTASLMAWSAFHGTDRKLSRYSNTIENTQSVLAWWDQLGDVDRAAPVNIQRLIHDCEDLFEREREGWLATSLSQKQTEGDDDEDGGDDPKPSTDHV